MIVADLILALQKMPQNATVLVPGYEYPEEVSSVDKIPKKDFDGYYTPGFNRNATRDCVVRVG